jgi:hypothetical protein
MRNLIKGDKVIALSTNNDNLEQTRVKGATYIVHDVMYCNKCGNQLINVGCKTSKQTVAHCDTFMLADGLAWTNRDVFLLLDDVEAVTNLKIEAVREQDYETAILIRDALMEAEYAIEKLKRDSLKNS